MTTTALTHCPSCGGPVALVRESVEVELGRRSARIEAERYRCDNCGEAFYSAAQADAVQRAAADELRRQEDLLGPADIKEIRIFLGLTQSQLERLLGVGPKTVVRWERGTVFQNRATDRLLRVLAAVPAAYEYLARTSGLIQADERQSAKVVPFRPKRVRVETAGDEAELPIIPKEQLS